MPRYKREHVFGAAGLLLGIGTLAIGGIALWWDYRRDRHNGIITADPKPQGITALPPAQKAPAPPPSRAQVVDLQRWLNMLGAHLSPDGKIGPATIAAVKAFQKEHGMAQTGQFDGMTQQHITNEAAYAARGQMNPEGAPRFAFRIVWNPSRRVWTSEDTMKFVTDIPGRDDRNHPPSDQEVAAVLVKHYGANSTVGSALAAHRYEWACSDCATAGLS